MEFIFVFFSNQAYLDAVSNIEKDIAISESVDKLKLELGWILVTTNPPLKEILEYIRLGMALCTMEALYLSPTLVQIQSQHLLTRCEDL